LTGHFSLPSITQGLFDIAYRGLYGRQGNRPLFTGFFNPNQQFAAIEGLPTPVFLDHPWRRVFDTLIRRETPFTDLALSPAPNRISFFAQPRVDHPVLKTTTDGAFHDLSAFLIYRAPNEPKLNALTTPAQFKSYQPRRQAACT
jgi:hypothetical protein